jgi:dihydroorotate dehydrogenase (NAD+) catalytic subunit
MLTLSSGKRDFTIRSPLTNAAGFLGWSDEGRSWLDLSRLGAMITNPVSLTPRSPAKGPRLLNFSGGFLLHTGHPNPGVSEIVRRHSLRWLKMASPVIVHILVQSPDEAAQLTQRLAEAEGVSGIEINVSEQHVVEVESFVRASIEGQLPVIAQVQLGSGAYVAQAAVQGGAAAISIGPPRGTLPASNWGVVQGRLYGRSVFPYALRYLERLVDFVEVPIISGGGIYTRDQVRVMLDAGATTVQFDAVLWTAPERVLNDDQPETGLNRKTY